MTSGGLQRGTSGPWRGGECLMTSGGLQTGTSGPWRGGECLMTKGGLQTGTSSRWLEEEWFGVRFPPMNRAYDKSLLEAAKQVAREMSIELDVHEGVYVCVGGPQFETIAEVNLLKILGCDAVGKYQQIQPSPVVGQEQRGVSSGH
uniref:purine-nucleoside phosphorylase n=1 Tax=Timema douglasi TaxID=61478 RepID=A0A7R8VZA5_TIMDO|nr:unnamed protein product [Timema douglasi]